MTKIYGKQLRVFVMLFLLGTVTSVYAQKQVVTGRITDVAGEGMPGVNVLLKGSTVGTTSDKEGNFSIEAAATDILVFSFIGYKSQELPVGNQTNVNIALEEDVETLSEIVVIGYGEVKKSDVTGAVASVQGETLKKTLTSGVDQALIGRVAGVTAVQMSGQPGASVSIRVRGTSSILGNVEPLYVVDGVPLSANNGTVYDYGLGAVGGAGKTTFSPLSTLNPNDIESIEVLKDASATAIYGNRGSNGVVIITTKRGKAGQSSVSYEGYYGVQEISKKLDMMNLREYAQFRNDFAAETAGQTPDPLFADPSVLGEGTDWQDAIFRSAPMQNHQLTFSGGTDKLRYAMSGNYFDQDGVAIGSEFKRYSLRLNLDADVTKWLKVGNSLSISRTDERLGQYDRGGIINTALKSTPDIPERNFDGSFSGGKGQGARVSPLAQALDLENYLKRTQILGNLYANIQLLPSLSFRTEFGGNADMANASSWKPTYDYGPNARNTVSSMSRQNNNNYFWQFKNYLTYTKTFVNVHNVSAMIGQEASEWGHQNTSGGATSLPTNDVKSINLGDPLTQAAGDSKGSGALSSYFGRLNYNFRDKYYATFTYRADGSSNFAEGNRWGYFPSAAVSWRVSQESFMAGIENIVSNVKLRAGWGQTGNSGREGYMYGSRLTTMATNLGLGFRVANHANPDLTWETAEQIDLGLDAGFLGERIQLTVDLYKKNVKDLLLRAPLPAYLGSLGNGAIIIQSPYVNGGEIENKGLEIALKSINTTGALQWETDFNITFNKNKLVSLDVKDAALDGFTGGSGNILISRTTEGRALGEFYGYKVAGIFKDKEDILNSPMQYSVDKNGVVYFDRNSTVWPGDIKFADIDGNDTIDVRDRTYLGSPQPKFTFGFNNTFRYKGFELDIFLVGTYGNKVYNFNKQGDGDGLADMRSAWNNQLQEVTGRAKLQPVTEPVGEWWNNIDNVQVMNPGTDIPRATNQDPNQNARVSDRYIEDGSYLRIRTVTLAYNIPSSILNKMRFTGLRVYARVQNAYTFTKYTGYDPEVGQDTWDGLVSGLDNGRYPSPRVYTLGVSANF
jgi:TonB-linked SusC/RagA family outer membrane protein